MTDSTHPLEVCPKCGARQRDPEARFCQFCGEIMPAAAATRRRIILGSAGLVLTLLVVVVVIRLIGKGGWVPEMLQRAATASRASSVTLSVLPQGDLPAASSTVSLAPATSTVSPTLSPRQSQQLNRRSCPRPPQNPPRRPRPHPLLGRADMWIGPLARWTYAVARTWAMRRSLEFRMALHWKLWAAPPRATGCSCAWEMVSEVGCPRSLCVQTVPLRPCRSSRRRRARPGRDQRPPPPEHPGRQLPLRALGQTPASVLTRCRSGEAIVPRCAGMWRRCGPCT